MSVRRPGEKLRFIIIEVGGRLGLTLECQTSRPKGLSFLLVSRIWRYRLTETCKINLDDMHVRTIPHLLLVVSAFNHEVMLRDMQI